MAELSICVDLRPQGARSRPPDISRADLLLCMTAIDWGFSVEATAARVMEESGKARENGQLYAMETARNAAAVHGAESGARAVKRRFFACRS